MIYSNTLDHINTLYAASVYFSLNKFECTFRIADIPVIKHHARLNSVEVDGSFFTSALYSTSHFEAGDLNREYKINDSLTCFYSEDKAKCIEWLNQKREEMIAHHEACLRLLKNSSIREESHRERIIHSKTQ